MYKSNDLFDTNKYLKRKTPQQEEFESKMNKEVQQFRNVIIKSFNETVKERSLKKPNTISKNWSATTMNGNVIGNLHDAFPHSMTSIKYGRDAYICKDFILWFKKLDSHYMPNNVKTSNTEMINNQLSLPFDESRIPFIYIGYQVNKTWDDLLGVYAVCIDNNQIQWISDLSHIGNDYIAPVIEETYEPIVEIKIKKDKKVKPAV